MTTKKTTNNKAVLLTRVSSHRQAEGYSLDFQEKAGRRYAEEKGTHDPLREQIEKMIAQDIALKAETKKQAAQVRAAQSDLHAARQEAQSLKTEAAKKDGAIKTLEARVQTLNQSEADLKTQLAAAEAKAKDAAGKLAAAQAALTAEKAKTEQLTKELNTLRGQQPAQ